MSEPSHSDAPYPSLPADLRPGYLATNGARLFFEIAGPHERERAAGAALVLVHAGIANHTMWDPHLAGFARRRRVLRYDLRGFGKSTAAADLFSHGDDLLALLDHLDIGSAVLLGVSYGGRAVLEAALADPERIGALVLVSPSLSGLEARPTPSEQALLERDEAFGAAGDWEAMAANDVALWVDGPGGPPGRAPAWVRHKVKAMALGDYVDFERRYPTEASWPRPRAEGEPLVERLAELAVPLLIVLGALDTSTTFAAAEAVEASVATAQRLVVPDTAHMLPLEVPELFVDRVLAFLADRGV